MAEVPLPVALPRTGAGGGAAGPVALLAAEWRKIRRTWILPLVMLGPLGVTLMAVIFYLLRHEIMAKQVAKGTPPFTVLMSSMGIVHICALMLGATLLASQIADVEHRSDTWKQLFAQPVSRAGVFVAKSVWLAGLLAAASVLMVAGYVAIWLWQGYGPIPWPDFGRAAALLYAAVLPLAALQLGSSALSKNQAGPLCAGILGPMFVVGGLPVPGWVPWTMPLQALSAVMGKPLPYQALWLAVAVEVVLLVALGAVLLSRRTTR